MAVRHGYGKIAGTDALVFAYDTGDTRNSYKGEPTTNDRYADMTQWNEYAGSTTISTSTDGFYKVTNTTYNGQHLINQSFSADDGGTYAFSVDVKPGLNLRYVALSFSRYGGWPGGQGAETYFDLQTGTYHGKLGSVDTDDYGITPNGDGSYRIYIVATRSGAITSNSNIFFFNSDPLVNRTYTGATNEYVFVRKPQLETKSHPTPYVAGTRSATQGLLDLTGNTSIDLSNVSFDSNAQKTFDGSNDYIQLSSTIRSNFTSAPNCVELVLKKSSADQQEMVVFDVDVTRWNLNYDMYVSNQWSFDFYDGTEHVIAAGNYDDEYVHFVLQQLDNGTMEIYANGELKGTEAAGNLAPNTSNPRIGSRSNGDSRYFEGELPLLKIYNRALTADEVRNNFRLYKTRFGI